MSFRSFTSSAVLLDAAYDLAVTHERTVYEMMYVALSERENCRFIKVDERMVNALGSYFPNVVWIGNLSSMSNREEDAE